VFNNTGNEYLDRPLRFGNDYETYSPAQSESSQIDAQAEGSWARVVSVRRAGSGQVQQVFALKVMRFHHVKDREVHDYFVSEVRALREFERYGFAPRLEACGYFRPPREGESHITDFKLTRDDWSLEQAKNELGYTTGDRPWLPFIIMEYIPYRYTCLNLAKHLTSYEAGDGRTQILPLLDFLDMAEQALEYLQQCQQAGFYYKDHKLEHTIWFDGRLRFIDWNAGRWLNDTEKAQQRIGQLEARLDLRNFTGVVLYPLLFGKTIKGSPIAAYSGNVGPFQAEFETDDITLRHNHDTRSIIDLRLLRVLGRAISDKEPYSSAEEYLNAIKEYHGILKKELGREYILYEKIIKDLREVQDKIEDAYILIRRLSNNSAEKEAKAECIRLYRSVVSLRNKSTIVVPREKKQP